MAGAFDLGTQVAANVASPAQWFARRFPYLDEFGEATQEELNEEHGQVVVKDICESFLAATVGAKAMSDAPTVYICEENRFYTYSKADGIYRERRKEALLSHFSALLLEAARACPGCDTRSLQFRLRDSGSLGGIINHAKGILAEPQDFFAKDLTEFIPCSNGMHAGGEELAALQP